MQVTVKVGMVLVKGPLSHGLHHSKCSVQQNCQQDCTNVSSKGSPTIIHQRFGHVGISTLEKMLRHQSEPSFLEMVLKSPISTFPSIEDSSTSLLHQERVSDTLDLLSPEGEAQECLLMSIDVY
jgi:hypothetical protein